MRICSVSGYALSASTALTMLAGCSGGSQVNSLPGTVTSQLQLVQRLGLSRALQMPCVRSGGDPRIAPFANALLLCSSTSSARTGLIALYTFNGTLNDASGNGKNAFDTGTPKYVNGAPFGGKAISFDGKGKAIVSAPIDITVARRPQVTLGAWVKAKALTTPEYGVVSTDDSNYDRSLDLDIRPTGSVTWSAFVGGSVVGKVLAVKDKWVFIAVSYDQSAGPGNYAFYVNDGSSTTVLTGADAFDGNSRPIVTIGENPFFDHPFHGDVANAFFYECILTRHQIDSVIAKGPSALPGCHKAQ